MARRSAWGLACVIGLLPGLAAGNPIAIEIEDKEIIPAPAGGTLTLDVTFRNASQRPELEDLIGYELAFLLDKVHGGGDLRFVPPYAEEPKPPLLTGSRRIFEVYGEAPSGTAFVLRAYDPDADGIDIPAVPVAAARLLLEYGPVTPPGEYHVVLNPDITVLASGPRGPKNLGIDVEDKGIVRFVPEPASGLVLVGGVVLALRRHRAH